VLDNLASIKDSIKAAHVKMIQQVDLKTGSSKEMIETLNSLSNTTVENEVFVKSMQKLMAGVPQYDISDTEVQQAISSLKNKLEGEFDKKTDAIITDLKKYLELLQKASENPYLFGGKVDFKFSPDLHHTGVSVVSDTIIKSTGNWECYFRGLQLPFRANVTATAVEGQQATVIGVQNKGEFKQLVGCRNLPEDNCRE
jgi:hypothetical protein